MSARLEHVALLDGRRARLRGAFLRLRRALWAASPVLIFLLSAQTTSSLASGDGSPGEGHDVERGSAQPLARELPVPFAAGVRKSRATSAGARGAPWSRELRAHIEELRRGRDGDVAIFAHDLRRNLTFDYQADRPMYLASGVKVLFLVELYRQREQGRLRFDEELWYRRDDVRDGASSMNRQKLGRRYPVSELMLYMTRDSDNAATDLLLERIGLDEVERTLVRERISGFGPLVNMMDVRREVYARLDPRAEQLDAVEVRDVRWRDGYNPRLDILKKHIGPPYGDYDEQDLELAYDDYYALGRNHASMRGAGDVLARLVEGTLVSPRASRAILTRLNDVWTDGHRTRGAVPEHLRLAHKTGTQRRRIVDLAVVWLEDRTPLVLCIAVQDLPHEEAEAVLELVAAKTFELASAHAASHPRASASRTLTRSTRSGR